MNVFIVDDSASIRDRIATMLSGISNTRMVGTAETADEAIEQIAASPPDVVVLDIRLRASNGLDVMRYVARECPATKVIILSNHSEDESRALFMKAGAHDFFDKSLEFDNIRSALTRLAATLPTSPPPMGQGTSH